MADIEVEKLTKTTVTLADLADSLQSLDDNNLLYLSNTYDEDNLISDFSYQWSSELQINILYGEQSSDTVSVPDWMSAEFEGINPNLLSLEDGGVINNLIYGATESGDIRRPTFRIYSARSSGFTFGGIVTNSFASVSYSSEELESIKQVYEKPTFSESLDNFISDMVQGITSVYDENSYQNAFFNKSKVGKIDYSKLSDFEQEAVIDYCADDSASGTTTTTTVTTTSATTTTSTSGGY